MNYRGIRLPHGLGNQERERRGLQTLLAVASATLVTLVALPLSGATSITASSRTGDPFPVIITTSAGTVRLAAAPTHIISLSPTATEMLFAEGAGHQVVAVDSDSDYPKSAPITKLSGLDPNIEAIAKYKPDLVILSFDADNIVKTLTALKIPVLLEPAATTLQSAYAQMDQIGKATGHLATGVSLVNSTKKKIAALVSAAPHFNRALSYYYELDTGYYSANSTTFIGRVLSLFNLKNIADAAKKASGGYPQLSSEFVLKSNPDLVFLGDTLCCGQSAKTVSNRAGWKNINAVRDGAVIGLNDDIASRWGPRVVILVQDVERALWALHRKLAK